MTIHDAIPYVSPPMIAALSWFVKRAAKAFGDVRDSLDHLSERVGKIETRMVHLESKVHETPSIRAGRY